ncbi:hypothetical protein [Methanohalophilus sp. DAL1]|uniref:hypothetical protein n=1 Tax=Methanohalophilus sp. DAL1 TaxID=1864608 RepID=UPI0025C328C7|nr:hypothetical protein [Methanohalophilus sp. DAL1]
MNITANGYSTRDLPLLIALFLHFSLMDSGCPRTALHGPVHRCPRFRAEISPVLIDGLPFF